MTEYSYKSKLEASKKITEEKGTELVTHVFSYFHAKTANMPSRWLLKTQDIRICFGDSQYSDAVGVSLSEKITIPADTRSNYGNTAAIMYKDLDRLGQKLADDTVDAKRKYNILCSEQRAFNKKVLKWLQQYKTTKQLEEAWKDVTRFYPEQLRQTTNNAIAVVPDEIINTIHEADDDNA
jgi:hypothetical protein